MDRAGNAELLSQCSQGNQEAWDEMVDRFDRLIRAVVRGYRLSAVDSEDVCQLTWYRLVQNVDRIRDPERLGQWIATVARREAGKARERGRRLVLVGDSEVLDGMSGRGESPEQIALREHRRTEVLRAIDSLSGQCRELLLMTLADPPASYQEMSSALSMNMGSIGPIRTRCLRRLRRALAAGGTHPDRADKPPAACSGCPGGHREPRNVRFRHAPGSSRTPESTTGREESP